MLAVVTDMLPNGLLENQLVLINLPPYRLAVSPGIGHVQAEQRVKDDTQAPNVRLEVAWLFLKNLRCHMTIGASLFHERLRWSELTGNAKVADFYSRYHCCIAALNSSAQENVQQL